MDSAARFTVSRIYARAWRDWLNEAAFIGKRLTYIESGGLLSRTFVVRGSSEAIVYVETTYREWAGDGRQVTINDQHKRMTRLYEQDRLAARKHF